MEAIVMLHVSPEDAQAELPGVSLSALQDFILLPLGIPLASDPETLAARVREVADPILDLHEEQEPRGVAVLPSTLSLEATTWDAAVEEVGELADWIEPAPAADATGLEGLFSAFSAMMPAGAGQPGALDMSQIAAQLQGAQGQALIAQAMNMAQQLAAGGQLAGLGEALQSGTGSGETGAVGDARDKAAPEAPPDLGALASQAQAMLQGADLDALATQAQAMLAGNPALKQRLHDELAEAHEGGHKDEEDGD